MTLKYALVEYIHANKSTYICLSTFLQAFKPAAEGSCSGASPALSEVVDVSVQRVS